MGNVYVVVDFPAARKGGIEAARAEAEAEAGRRPHGRVSLLHSEKKEFLGQPTTTQCNSGDNNYAGESNGGLTDCQ